MKVSDILEINTAKDFDFALPMAVIETVAIVTVPSSGPATWLLTPLTKRSCAVTQLSELENIEKCYAS